MTEEYSNFNDNEEGRTKSKYNSAIAQLYRIDNLWRDAHNHSRSGELIKWNSDLDRVWCELAGDLNLKKKNDIIINDNYKKIQITFAEHRRKLINKIINVSIFNERIYQLLMEKELFLRRMQNELGKGTAFEDEMEDEWD